MYVSRTMAHLRVRYNSMIVVILAAPSRRSDLQILGFCLLKWYYGALPWTGVADQQKVQRLKEKYGCTRIIAAIRWSSFYSEILQKKEIASFIFYSVQVR